MTDFIHEHPKNQPEPTPAEPAPPAVEEEAKPVSEHERQKKVYTYVAVLFVAAFLLILWTFLMNHRSNQQMLSELKENTNTLQTVIEQNTALDARILELEAENKALRESVDTMEQAQNDSFSALCALDWLREIQRAYAARSYDEARKMLLAFVENGLVPHLSAQPLHTFDGADADSPAAVYAQLERTLFPDGLPEN